MTDAASVKDECAHKTRILDATSMAEVKRQQEQRTSGKLKGNGYH
jgi:hypothetical protein